MAVLTADKESQTAELSDSAFEAFCDDIAGMFDAEVSCTRQDIGTGTVKDVQKHFKKLAAVHHVEATGALNGTYHLLFDQAGLFILSGVIVMLPERRIREEIKRGSVDDAENLLDAAREVGNLLVGSWDRIFREECEGHDHFRKTGTFIGKPWENLDETGVAPDTDLLFVLYEMTVEPYPSFCCAAVFPQTVLTSSTSEAAQPATDEPGADEPVADEPAAVQAEVAAAPAAAPAATAVSAPAEPAPPAESARPTPAQQIESLVPEEEPAEPEAVEPKKAEPPKAEPLQAATEPSEPEATPAPAETPSEPAPAPAAPAPAAPSTAAAIPPDIRATVEAVVGDVAPEVAADKPVGQAQAPSGGYIDRMFDELTEYSCDTTLTQLLKVPAKDIMVPEVVWCDPEDAVQDVIAKMQQHNTGYVLVGRDGVLEGLVSNSNILGAVSPYLRPMFAKWHRPEDDATLEIKIKWMMSRPVRTVTPDATLASMVESMRRFGGRCLPVVDREAKVRGIVTVFDILLHVLEADKACSWEGRPPQAPPLLI